MYDKIIIGYNRSEQAEDAIAFGRRVGGALGSELRLVEVMPYEPLLSEVAVGPPTTLAEQRNSTRQSLEKAARKLGTEAQLVESTSPARGLHQAAEGVGADLVVIGSCHRGRLGRVLLGSVGRGLVNGAPCPVAVVPSGYRDVAERRPSTIGVGYDGSEESQHALEAAADVAGRLGATLRAIRIVPPVDYGFSGALLGGDPDLARLRFEFSERQVNEALADLSRSLPTDSRVIEGEPAAALVDESGNGLDVLYVGPRGYGRVRGVLLGSVSAELIMSAHCPVVAVPRQIERPAAAPARTARATA